MANDAKMANDVCKQFAIALSELVEDDRPWKDKLATIRIECEKADLEEFLSWFDDDEEDDDAA
jgi:hypothetical protein